MAEEQALGEKWICKLVLNLTRSDVTPAGERLSILMMRAIDNWQKRHRNPTSFWERSSILGTVSIDTGTCRATLAS